MPLPCHVKVMLAVCTLGAAKKKITNLCRASSVPLDINTSTFMYHCTSRIRHIREINETSRTAVTWQKKSTEEKKNKNLKSQTSISTPRVGNMVRGVRVTPSGTAKRKRIITLWKRRFACQGEMQASPQFHRNSREKWEFGEVHPGMEEVYSREPLTRRAEIWKVSPGLLLLSAQM